MSVRRATAIVVTRGEADALEVLLVQRSPRLRFFGGYHAFPGGVVDAADRELGLPPADGAAGPDGARATGARATGTANEPGVLRACAMRELFEETGLWLHEGGDGGSSPASGGAGSGEGALDADALEATRRELLEGEASRWLSHRRAGRRPARQPAHRPDATGSGPVSSSGGGPSLRELGEITTPAFAPVRYRTTFFEAEVGADFEPRIVPGELVGGGFVRPGDAIRAWRAGELAIAPPVLFALELLADDPGAFAARFRAATEALATGRLHPIRFTPGFLVAPLMAATKPPATTTNTAVVGEERLWVIDPAPTDAVERDRLLEHLQRQREAGREVAGVLATHHHPDHVGAIDVVCREFGVSLHAHPECLVRLDRAGEVRAARADAGAVAIEDGASFLLGAAPDGRPEWRLHAMATPGHAPDHLVFLEDRYRAVAAGDLLSGLSTVVIDPPDGHLRTYERSLERLRAARPGTIVPGHGPAFRDGADQITRVLDHRDRRERKVLEALGDRPCEAAALLEIVYDDVPVDRHGLAARSLEACLLALEEDGRARNEGGGWVRVGARGAERRSRNQ